MNEIISDKYKIYIYDNELSGTIFFPLFNKELELYSTVYQGTDHPTLVDAKRVAEYIQNIKKTDRIYKDFVEGVSNFYNDYLKDDVEGTGWEYRAQYTDLDLSISDEEIVKLLQPQSIGILKEGDKIAFWIFFRCPWEEEHGLGWMVYNNQTVYVSWGSGVPIPWEESIKKDWNRAPLYCNKISKPYISAELEEKFYETREKFKKEDRRHNYVGETGNNSKSVIIVIILLCLVPFLIYGFCMIMDNAQKNKKEIEEKIDFEKEYMDFELEYEVPSKFKIKSKDYSIVYEYKEDDISCSIDISYRDIYDKDFDLIKYVNDMNKYSNREYEENEINGHKWIVYYNLSTTYYAEFDSKIYTIRYNAYTGNNYCSENKDIFENSLKFNYFNKEFKVRLPYSFYNYKDDYMNKDLVYNDDGNECTFGFYKSEVDEDFNLEEEIKNDIDTKYGGFSGEVKPYYIRGYRWLNATNENNDLYYIVRNKELYKVFFSIYSDSNEQCYKDKNNILEYDMDFILKE